MPHYDLPTAPLRYCTLAVIGNTDTGVIIGSSDIIEYAQIIGHAALSELHLPQDAKTRILVVDTAMDRQRVVHNGNLDSEGMPVWDGRPLLRRGQS